MSRIQGIIAPILMTFEGEGRGRDVSVADARIKALRKEREALLNTIWSLADHMRRSGRD